MGFLSSVRAGWNAFASPRRNETSNSSSAVSYGADPSRVRLGYSNERSIIASIYTRLSVDAASMVIQHVMVDENGRYTDDVKSGLADILGYEANEDQGPRAFRQDIFMTMLTQAAAAIVPIECDVNPETEDVFDVLVARVGTVSAWGPQSLRVNVLNHAKGSREDVVLPKAQVAVAYNPFSYVMNEPNSTLKRLVAKLNLLDVVDEQSSNGKLDLLIQLPYQIKSEARRDQAEQRRVDIEMQLKNSKYGIAYVDATEKVTQLNRPAENNLMGQVEYLVELLYNQLGLTKGIMDGTADEATMKMYYARTIEPLVEAVVEALQRSFLGRARTENGERVMYFVDPFKFASLTTIAEVADKFARNEIMSSNDVRHKIGLKPDKDPKSDKLINSNMPAVPPAQEKTSERSQNGGQESQA